MYRELPMNYLILAIPRSLEQKVMVVWKAEEEQPAKSVFESFIRGHGHSCNVSLWKRDGTTAEFHLLDVGPKEEPFPWELKHSE